MNSCEIDYAKDHEKESPEGYWEFRKILELFEPWPNCRLLEIGCNTGEFCYLLKNRYDANPIGIDINRDAISIAKTKYPNIEFEVRNLFELEGQYDAIYMQHVLEHLKYPRKAVVKLRSILVKAGKLIVSCPNGWAFPSKIIHAIQGKRFCYDPTHLYEYNPINLTKLLKTSGYQTYKTITSPLGIPYLSRSSAIYSIPSFLFGDHIFCIARKR